eukprot:EG_transcript_22560
MRFLKDPPWGVLRSWGPGSWGQLEKGAGGENTPLGLAGLARTLLQRTCARRGGFTQPVWELLLGKRAGWLVGPPTRGRVTCRLRKSLAEVDRKIPSAPSCAQNQDRTSESLIKQMVNETA